MKPPGFRRALDGSVLPVTRARVFVAIVTCEIALAFWPSGPLLKRRRWLGTLWRIAST